MHNHVAYIPFFSLFLLIFFILPVFFQCKHVHNSLDLKQDFCAPFNRVIYVCQKEMGLTAASAFWVCGCAGVCVRVCVCGCVCVFVWVGATCAYNYVFSVRPFQLLLLADTCTLCKCVCVCVCVPLRVCVCIQITSTSTTDHIHTYIYTYIHIVCSVWEQSDPNEPDLKLQL